jgi:hypothetical protein
MPHAVSTSGQGADAFISMPSCSINAGTNTDISGIEIDVKPLTGSAAGFVNLLGSSSNNTHALRINTITGTLQWRNSSTVYLESAAGSVSLNERHKYGAEWEESTQSLYLTKNGVRIAGPYVAPAANSLITNITWNQIGKVGSSAPGTAAFELYGVRTYGTNCTYQSQWDDSGSSGSGTAWVNDASDRNLTLISFAGTTNSWWVFYSNLYIGEGTISVSATASAALASSKVGNASVSAVAAAVAATQGSKIGSAVLSLPTTAGILLSASKNTSASITVPINAVLGIAANKVGVAPLYVEAVADISLYAGNIVVGEGTFSVTATALASVQGEKVGQSQVHFAAAAAVYSSVVKQGASGVTASANAAIVAQASKTGHATTQLAGAVSLSADGYKVGLGSVAVLASATISLSGSNPAALPAPVALLFVRSSSRYTHSMRTSGRYSYHLKTSSGGARV